MVFVRAVGSVFAMEAGGSCGEVEVTRVFANFVVTNVASTLAPLPNESPVLIHSVHLLLPLLVHGWLPLHIVHPIGRGPPHVGGNSHLRLLHHALGLPLGFELVE